MFTHAIRKSAPPVTMILLNFFTVILRWHIEPEKWAFAMLFILAKVSNVYVAILIQFDSMPWFFVIIELSLVYFSCAIDSDTYNHTTMILPLPCFFLLWISPKYNLCSVRTILTLYNLNNISVVSSEYGIVS